MDSLLLRSAPRITAGPAAPCRSPGLRRPGEHRPGGRAGPVRRPGAGCTGPGRGTGGAMADLGWLGVVRHGESTGNVAATAAETAGAEDIDIPERDADVPLSDTGREQAAAVNQWLRDQDRLPDVA